MSNMPKKHSALLFARGKVLVKEAYNSSGGNPFSVHAEQHALINLLKLFGNKNARHFFDFTKPLEESKKKQLANIIHNMRLPSKMKLVVIRIDATGSFAQSRPCNNCIDYLRLFGVKHVIYSTPTGDFIQEKVDVMDKLHDCMALKTYRQLKSQYPSSSSKPSYSPSSKPSYSPSSKPSPSPSKAANSSYSFSLNGSQYPTG